MGLIDSILGQIGSNVDVANLATKVGLPQDQVEQAIAALSHAHTQDGDTVDTAAQSTGIAPDTLQQIVGHIGGEGSLGQFAQMITGAGGEGAEGGVGGMLSGLAGKFFGNKA